ncbi:MAG: hypothetical protein PHU53_01340 [Thermoplasmata archaeon]|nr:hypothetical protein [Thermoplasmata archaeon]
MAGILIFLVALCARLVPLQFSDLPYNIDGFPLARISELFIETGSNPSTPDYGGLLAYNMKLPIFSLLLAVFSLVLGIAPFTLLPYFCALIGSFAVVFIFALARKLTGNDLAAFSAGIFAALTGLFVYVTAAAMKQLLAITLLCFVLYLYTNRRDWRFRAAMAVTLVILPFTHHLTSLIALLILSFALVGTAFRRSEHHVRTLKEFTLDAVFGPGILMMSVFYYKLSNMEIASEVLNANDAVLLASVAIIMAVLARIMSMTAQTKPWFFLRKDAEMNIWTIFDEKVLVLIGGIGALYLNSRLNLFTGAQTTSDTLLRMIFPYLALSVIALIGFNVLRYSKFTMRHLVIGMFMAPLSVMGFSLLRAMDVFSFMVVYRSYNFIDIPLAITAGVGIAYIIGRLLKQAKENRFFAPLPAFALGIFIMFCAISLPLAYSSEELFNVQEVTYEYETYAMDWAADHGISNVVTDQRYGDIIEPYRGIESDNTGPWRIRGSMLHAGDTLLVSNGWTAGGAQMYPLENIVFEEADMAAKLDSWNVCYMGGPEGSEIIIAVV